MLRHREAYDADVDRNKSLYSELRCLGVRYDFGSSYWDYNIHEQQSYRNDLLELIVVQLCRKDADVDNLRQTWSTAYDIREKGRKALKDMKLKTEDLESLYKDLHDRWQVIERIRIVEKELVGKWKWSAEEQLGQRAGIDMTTDVLKNFEQKLKYVSRIWELEGQASVEMVLRSLRDI